jgi:hypothetical protein
MRTINIKVKELIDILKTMDQDAFVCSVEEIMHPTYEYSTIENCTEHDNVEIVLDDGEVIIGKVVAIC